MKDAKNSPALNAERRSPPRNRQATCGRWAVELLPARPYCARYTSPEPAIGFAFDSQSGDHAFASDRSRPFRTRPNSLAFVPAGCDVFSQSRKGGEYLKLTAATSPRCGERDLWSEQRIFNDRIDPRAIAAAQAIRKLLLGDRPPDPLGLEAQTETLLHCVDDALVTPASQSGAERWMTPARLRKIEDLVEQDLDKVLTVASLAQALGLSPGFFSRAVKAAIGKAPHDYIIDRRVARARSLLRDTAQPLSDIALASGFSSHAHMSAVFRTRLGAMPIRLRAATEHL